MRHAFSSIRPGRISYRAGLALQEQLLRDWLPGDADLLLLLEHPPTITLGRGSDMRHLITSTEQLQAAGVSVIQAARGGDVTYHGPGQLVGYPLVDLNRRNRDLHRHLRSLEDVLLLTLERFDINGCRDQGRTGVWVDDSKIASIGVGVRRWITWHGFALNLEQQDGFRHIVPCGLQGVRMTSMAEQLGTVPSRTAVEEAVIDAFAQVFNSNYLGIHDKKTTPQA